MSWKPIEQFNGRYEVSSNGEVRSLITNKILRPAIDGWGYKRVAMMKDGKLVTQKVHRLVAQMFIPNPENKPQVNHKNGVKTDNWWMNLEWATQSENIRHAHANKLIIMPRGGDVYNAKEIIQYSECMEVLKVWDSASTVERELGYNGRNIRACANFQRRSCKGFIWRYK